MNQLALRNWERQSFAEKHLVVTEGPMTYLSWAIWDNCYVSFLPLKVAEWHSPDSFPFDDSWYLMRNYFLLFPGPQKSKTKVAFLSDNKWSFFLPLLGASVSDVGQLVTKINKQTNKHTNKQQQQTLILKPKYDCSKKREQLCCNKNSNFTKRIVLPTEKFRKV